MGRQRRVDKLYSAYFSDPFRIHSYAGPRERTRYIAGYYRGLVEPSKTPPRDRFDIRHYLVVTYWDIPVKPPDLSDIMASDGWAYDGYEGKNASGDDQPRYSRTLETIDYVYERNLFSLPPIPLDYTDEEESFVEIVAPDDIVIQTFPDARPAPFQPGLVRTKVPVEVFRGRPRPVGFQIDNPWISFVKKYGWRFLGGFGIVVAAIAALFWNFTKEKFLVPLFVRPVMSLGEPLFHRLADRMNKFIGSLKGTTGKKKKKNK